MKDFDANEHMSCPQCGFETVWVNPQDRTIALVRKDGTPDPETLERDTDADKNDGTEPYIMCNHNSCNWTDQGEGDWMDGVIESVNELLGVPTICPDCGNKLSSADWLEGDDKQESDAWCDNCEAVKE